MSPDCAVLEHGRPPPLHKLQRAAWYQALYARLTPKTRQRDLRQLREQALIKQDDHNRLWPGFVDPADNSIDESTG
ncbi:hypothetical protein RM531_12145 [Salinisphaera sp. P385]|uniref:Uncharacterized protein n=1 Tax=Spectribacter acetivorans TaxID=3075603 RepID=A0ABU3B9S2_9GAMM|nr:hypothetical protein [Salinisphaera sp. P385]MDT0619227.1 hypothetical protein [Salinisphaera sp. P385]